MAAGVLDQDVTPLRSACLGVVTSQKPLELPLSPSGETLWCTGDTTQYYDNCVHPRGQKHRPR